MTLRIAGIDVHKKMLAVVVGAVSDDSGEIVFERRKFDNSESGLHELRDWFEACGVEAAVLESTAQYWRATWLELESRMALHLAQSMSNRAPRGRKSDFADAERLVRRLVSQELVLSFVPGREQRLWRTLAREKLLARRARVQQINALEAFLEQTRIKLSSVVSDLTGVTSGCILRALAAGVQDPAVLAGMRAPEMRCTEQQLAGALAAAPQMQPMERALLKQMLDRIELLGQQIGEIDAMLATCLKEHQDAVIRVAAVPGFGADSAQQAIAEVGAHAEAFPSAAHLASWVGCCPGREESAGVSKSDRSPKGNRPMRRLLAQCANAAVKAKGSVYELFYRRKVAHLGHAKAVWAVAHKLCKMLWKVLHEGVSYEERGPRLNSQQEAKQLERLKHALRRLGYDPATIRKLDPQRTLTARAASA